VAKLADGSALRASAISAAGNCSGDAADMVVRLMSRELVWPARWLANVTADA
jgi:hypothetical protein